MAHRISLFFVLSLLGLSFLSVGEGYRPARKIACLELNSNSGVFPLPGSLFGEVQNEALRKTTLDYYDFLTRIELQTLMSLNSARAMYGLPEQNLANAARPIARNFDPTAGQFAQGHLWGNLGRLGDTNQFSVAKHFTPPSNFARGPDFSLPSFTANPVQITGTALKPVNNQSSSIGGIF